MHAHACSKAPDPTAAVIAAATEVHRVLGGGHLDEMYRDAMAIELGHSGVPFVQEPRMPVFYRGKCLGALQPTDFLCGDLVVAIRKQQTGWPEPAHVGNWLRASRRETAILLDFRGPVLQHKGLAYKVWWQAEPEAIRP